MGVEASVRHTAVISPPVSALVAVLVAYWATDSWRVAFAALATIASAVVLMLAALVAVGWEFGVVEELCVTLLIGGSVDYCIHLAHAYAHEGGGEPKRHRRERKDLSRAEKTSAALEHAAGTITGAARRRRPAATLLACRVEVLVKIGATIVVNTAAGTCSRSSCSRRSWPRSGTRGGGRDEERRAGGGAGEPTEETRRAEFYFLNRVEADRVRDDDGTATQCSFQS